MNSLNITLNEFYAKYKDWVRKNPQTISEVESTIKWISYFIAGKINRSVVLTELLYSASNLLVLFNDIILQSPNERLESAGEKIKIWLSVVEYSEVFMEISSKRLWGERGKWVLIVCIQLLKCIGRLTLLLHYKERMVSAPAIMPCRRGLERGGSRRKSSEGPARISNIAFSLKRSGRIIRKVESAPPIHSRLWKPPTFATSMDKECEKPDKRVIQQHLIGEVLYTLKPLVTLGTIMKSGQSTWKPWLVSAAADLMSLYLIHTRPNNSESRHSLTRSERLEISRRRLSLLLYLMRSPFYERRSKDKINSFLNSLARNIPLARIVCQPIQEYLPHWQETYFYLWSS